MSRVVAWPGPDEPGYVNLHWNSARVNMAGRPYRDLDAFMGMAQWGALHPSVCENVWFCTSTQSTVGKTVRGTITAGRHASNALKLKAIWFDIDVKPEKGYASPVEAAAALGNFQTDTGLPTPSALVASGSGGLHVYWISDKPLSVEDWRPFAEGLRAEGERCGLRFDAGVTTDAARILRVPGTYNGKTKPPKVVRLINLGDSYDFAALPAFQRLAEIGAKVHRGVTVPVTRPMPAFDLSSFPPPSPLFREAGIDVTRTLSAGVHEYDDTPLDPAAIFQNCPHFYNAAVTHGAGFGQGLWMMDMLAATFWKDGERWAHYMSKGYNKYSQAETQAMFERKKAERGAAGLGWPSCSAFANEGAHECATCPYRNRIRSPLNLAERQRPAFGTPPPMFSTAAATNEARALLLPDGYCLDQHGIICKLVQRDMGGGQMNTELAPLFHSKIRRIELTRSGTVSGFRFETSLDMDRWGPVFVADELLASDQQLLACMRRQGVKPYTDNERAIRGFMTSWAAKIDAERARLHAAPLGWVMEGDERAGFAFGGKVYRKDGTVTAASVQDPQMADQFSPKGSLEPWIEALQVITEQKHPALECLVAMAFAAPLMWVPAEYNGILCAYSNGGGAGKSTAIKVGLAVWGDPKKSKENSLSSIKGSIQKLGMLNNLPLYFDEINREDKMVAIHGVLDLATEGVGPTTLRQDRTQNVRGEWQTLIGIGANASFWELIRKKAKQTDAQLRRVFEITVEKRGKTRDRLAVSQLMSKLETNHGVIGDMYAQYLARNVDAVKRYVSDICVAFDADVKDHMEDRFWSAMVGTMIAGAGIANALDPRINFNIQLLYDYLKQEFLRMRREIANNVAIGTSPDYVADQLGQFFDEVVGNIAWTDRCASRGKQAPVTVFHRPRDDEPIYVRIAVADRKVYIARGRFEEWAQKHGYSLTPTYDGIRKHYGGKVDGRLTLSGGVLSGGLRQPVIEIPVPANSPEFEELLYKYVPASQRP